MQRAPCQGCPVCLPSSDWELAACPDFFAWNLPLVFKLALSPLIQNVNFNLGPKIPLPKINPDLPLYCSANYHQKHCSHTSAPQGVPSIRPPLATECQGRNYHLHRTNSWNTLYTFVAGYSTWYWFWKQLEYSRLLKIHNPPEQWSLQGSSSQHEKKTVPSLSWRLHPCWAIVFHKRGCTLRQYPYHTAWLIHGWKAI